jgi:hypothetical protein
MRKIRKGAGRRAQGKREGFRCQVSGACAAAGLKSGQFDRKRNSEKANIE